MLWPHARFRRARNVELQQRVAEARRERPESEAWLGLLEAALGESEAGAGWDAAVPRAAVERPVKAPLLAHAGIAVDGRAARRWVRRLLKVSDRMNPRTIDAVALLEAAVCQDDARSDALAVAAGADPHALRVVGQMRGLAGRGGVRGARAQAPAALRAVRHGVGGPGAALCLLRRDRP